MDSEKLENVTEFDWLGKVLEKKQKFDRKSKSQGTWITIFSTQYAYCFS